MIKDCRFCKKYYECYTLCSGSDRFPGSMPDYYNRILTRDLCVNNDKFNFEDRRSNSDRRTH